MVKNKEIWDREDLVSGYLNGVRKVCDFFMPVGGAGPWKGVSGEGRERCGESVIQVQKNDVNVNALGVPANLAPEVAKNRKYRYLNGLCR